jgi:hypothetical protein
MRNALFTNCVVCGDRTSWNGSDFYCADHRQVARRALARVGSSTEILLRLAFLLLMLGILVFASHS